jgi:hypothetical protein
LEFIHKVNHKRVVAMGKLIIPDPGAFLLIFLIEPSFYAKITSDEVFQDKVSLIVKGDDLSFILDKSN